MQPSPFSTRFISWLYNYTANSGVAKGEPGRAHACLILSAYSTYVIKYSADSSILCKVPAQPNKSSYTTDSYRPS